MKCPQCRFENPEGAKFCNECGGPLKLTCPSCGSSFQLESRFCDECGHPLKKPLTFLPIDYSQPHSYTPKFLADKILTTRSAIEGERKIVTVLFADVVNSTHIFENLDPEEVHDIMDGCFKITMDEIHKYEGTINQFTGDGVMAIFGAPIAHEDDAHRACYAALSIQEALKIYGQNIRATIGADFKIRIGLNTGPVVVGSIGDDLRMDYTADGDTVNLASRLETMATPGTILVSQQIFDRVRDHFQFQALGKVKIKGKEKNQYVYRLIDKNRQPGFRSGIMVYSDMVGRERELDRLELYVLRAKNAEGAIVNIIGEAGVGKSRLIEELKKGQTLKNTFVLEGRALSMGRNLNFHPVIDIIKSWASIQEDDTESEAVHKLESSIKTVHPEQADEIFPFLATMMGMKLTGKFAERVKGIEGEGLEILIQKNLMDLIIKASELSTLIFIIEDVHWADTSSIELLITLFRLAKDHRILFINLFRPHHRDTGEKLLNAVIENYPKLHTEIYIQPLGMTHSNMLINNLLEAEGLPHDVRESIHLRSEGNPLFIEEVVRSFIDEGLVHLKHGKFTISGDIKSAIIPNTIQELLMSRIDRLDEQTKSLLKIAAVIGRNFFYRLLAVVADTIGSIDDQLNYLQTVELIREGNRMGEIEYIFKHALVQETAYASILRQTRKELHLRVAQCAERLYSERLNEFYGMLAFHYSSGENFEKTEEYLIKAGEEALKSSASNEALHYYQEALNLYLTKAGSAADHQKVAMLEKNIAIALYNRGQYVEGVKYFDNALNYYWGRFSKNPIAAVFRFFSGFLHLLISLYFPFLKFKKIPTQKDIEIIDLFLKKVKALSMIDPKRFFLEYMFIQKTITNFGLTEFALGYQTYAGASALFSFTGISFKLSGRILDSVKDIAPEDDPKVFIIYDLLATIHNLLNGNWKAIRNYDEDLINQNLKRGELYDASLNLYWHSFLYIQTGSFDIARSIVEKLNEIYEVYSHDLSKSLKYEASIHLSMESRQLNIALIEVEEGIDFAKKAGLSYFLLEMYACQTFIHILKGDIEKAKKSLKDASKIRGEVDSPVPFQLSNFCRSQLEYYIYRLNEFMLDGKTTAASDHRKQAFKSCQMMLRNEQKVALLLTAAYKLKGLSYWLINEQDKALKWWQKAIEEGERLGARPELSRVYFEVGKRLLDAKSKYKKFRGIKAEEYLEKAATLFKEMNLQWDLDELSHLTEGSGHCF